MTHTEWLSSADSNKNGALDLTLAPSLGRPFRVGALEVEHPDSAKPRCAEKPEASR